MKIFQKVTQLYSLVLSHKIVTVCILFTFFTLLDTIIILTGNYPPKNGLDSYVHLLGRFTLHSILVLGLWIFHTLRTKIKSGLFVYFLTMIITWILLFLYIQLNGLFTELHPQALYYMTRSYLSMYFLAGIVILIFNVAKRFRKARS